MFFPKNTSNALRQRIHPAPNQIPLLHYSAVRSSDIQLLIFHIRHAFDCFNPFIYNHMGLIFCFLSEPNLSACPKFILEKEAAGD